MFKLLTYLIILFAIIFPHAYAEEDQLSQDEIERFAKVMAQIKYYYIEDVDFKTLFSNAIKGMMRGLDPHSDFIDEAQIKSFETQSTGQYGGLGIEIIPEPGALRVVTPFDDTPAQRAGIKTGDLIIGINGKILKNLSTDEAINMLRGKPNTKVELTVFTPGDKSPRKVVLVREVIKLKAVREKIIGNDIGYIRISIFNKSTYQAVNVAINKLKRNPKGLKGLIIDVRNNPGGLLDSVVQISDLFLDADKLGTNKKIVSIKGRAEGTNFAANATSGDKVSNVPIVVLVNQGSASASEILAAALRDHNRAIIVGTRTFGKGSVQSVIPVDKTSLIKLTTALYYTPNNVSIQAKGITPDVVVSLTEIQEQEGDSNMLDLMSEQSFVDHIQNGTKDKKKNVNDTSNINKIAYDDFQLYQAVRILQGIQIIQKTV
ncbi:MAG: peptidase S41 [Legionellales bacterium]|nr:peptidase S41 [Legionellales bacterium]OUX64793.1 MAG: hypothetical protein CBE41_02595 [Gammaproteobacteria bacterium TMED281]